MQPFTILMRWTALALGVSGLLGAAAAAQTADTETLAHGKYLTQIGNCSGCHSAPGGEPFAGGLRLASRFGTFITPNITPDPATGIGDWSQQDFWAALHLGQRKDGAALYPACPYPSYTQIRRADVNAIYAYLSSIPAVEKTRPDHSLQFPYRYRTLVNLWQALYFEPGEMQPEPGQNGAWNRGRYLTEGLGHCNECHRGRGLLGGPLEAANAPGATIHGWYAPPLADPQQAGLQHWSTEQAAGFLQAGKNDKAVMLGSMKAVVFDSLQYLSDQDARAMATYLKSIPEQDVEPSVRLLNVTPSERRQAMQRGEDLYAQDCADCHGENGQGKPRAPALAGNRAVTMENPTNVINIIRRGGFAAATSKNPRPYSMPGFNNYSDGELAAVITYIRSSWGNEAAPVPPYNVSR